MALTYADTLESAISALQQGEPMEAVLARTPQFGPRLQQDVRLTSAVTRLSVLLPQPSTEARDDASARLMARLSSLRAPVVASPQRASTPARRLLQAFSPPRYAFAALVLVVLTAVVLGFLAGGGSRSAEAALVEGVVISKDGGSITLQTADSTQEIIVPAGTQSFDASGAGIDLDSISVGEVIAVRVQRDGRVVIASRIQRIENSLDSWCDAAPERCRPVRSRLDEAARTCEAGDAVVCRRLAGFCDSHPLACPADAPVLPPAQRPQPTSTAPIARDPQPANTPVQRPLQPIVTPTVEATPVRPTETPSRPPTSTPALDVQPPRPTSTRELRQPTATATPTRPRPSSTPTQRPERSSTPSR